MERNQKNKTKGNGEGTIYKNNKTGLYIGQYVVNGKRKSVYQRKNEKIGDFKKRFNNILSSINQGSYIESDNISLYSILINHIEQKHKDGITTDRSYSRDLETLQATERCCKNFIYKSINKVLVEDIEDSKERIRKYSKTVIDKIWRLLYKGFKIAYSRRRILFNIMDDETLTKPISLKEFKKIEALTIDEENKLLHILDNEEREHKYRNIVKAQLISAMRIGELLARTKDDYNKTEKTLLVNNTLTQDKDYRIILGEHTKTFNKRTGIDSGARTLILIGDLAKLENIIIEQINKKVTNIYNLLFWNYKKNTFITPSEINSWLKRLNKKYNITKNSLSTHVLRHTRITRWREQGMDIQIIQYLVGHVEGSPLTTNTYTSIFDNFVKQELEKKSI